MLEEGVVPPGLVVRDDEQDIGPDGVLGTARGRRDEREGGGEEEWEEKTHGRMPTVWESWGDGNPGPFIGEHFLYSHCLTHTLPP